MALPRTATRQLLPILFLVLAAALFFYAQSSSSSAVDAEDGSAAGIGFDHHGGDKAIVARARALRELESEMGLSAGSSGTSRGGATGNTEVEDDDDGDGDDDDGDDDSGDDDDDDDRDDDDDDADDDDADDADADAAADKADAERRLEAKARKQDDKHQRRMAARLSGLQGDPAGMGGLGGLLIEDLLDEEDDDPTAASNRRRRSRRRSRKHGRRAKKSAAEDDDDSEGDDSEDDGDDTASDKDGVLGGDADADADVVDERLLIRNREGREWAKYLPSDPRFLPPSGIKFAFVHLPKAGGRTLECTLQWPMRIKGDYVGLEMPRVIQSSNMRLTMGHREWEHVMPAAYALNTNQAKVREVVSVIMVRDPVTRVASEFFTGLRRPALHRINQDPETWKSGHILCRGWIRKSLKQGNITLDEFAHWPEQDDLWAHWNRMVNMLTWKREGVVRTDLSPLERYGLAVERLKRMDILGVQERFEETMGLINCKLLEVTGEEMSHYNWCANLNKYNHTISAATAERLARLNHLDVRLYDEAIRIFDDRVRFWKSKPCFQRHFVCPKDMYCGRKFAMDRAMVKQEGREQHSRNVICTKACRRSDLPPPPPIHNVTVPAR